MFADLSFWVFPSWLTFKHHHQTQISSSTWNLTLTLSSLSGQALLSSWIPLFSLLTLQTVHILTLLLTLFSLVTFAPLFLPVSSCCIFAHRQTALLQLSVGQKVRSLADQETLQDTAVQSTVETVTHLEFVVTWATIPKVLQNKPAGHTRWSQITGAHVFWLKSSHLPIFYYYSIYCTPQSDVSVLRPSAVRLSEWSGCTLLQCSDC